MNKSKLRSSKIVFLINGCISTPLKIKGDTFILKNTCAFDSVVSLVCIGYYDFPKYKHYIDSQNDFFKYCKSIAINRAPNSKYCEIYKLLKSNGLLEASRTSICSVQCFDAQCNVQHLLCQFKVSSIVKKTKYINCPTLIEHINLLSPNMKIIVQNNFTKEILEKELETCYSKNLTKKCSSCLKNVQIKYNIQPNIFVEVDLMGYYGQESCQLGTIPFSIMMNGYK